MEAVACECVSDRAFIAHSLMVLVRIAKRRITIARSTAPREAVARTITPLHWKTDLFRSATQLRKRSLRKSAGRFGLIAVACPPPGEISNSAKLSISKNSKKSVSYGKRTKFVKSSGLEKVRWKSRKSWAARFSKSRGQVEKVRGTSSLSD